ADTVKGACAPADLVEQYQAPAGRIIQDVGALHHFDHECALSPADEIGGPDTGEYSVHYPDLCTSSRNERTDLGHKHNKGGLPHIGRFARHVRAGDYEQPVVAAVHERIVW